MHTFHSAQKYLSIILHFNQHCFVICVFNTIPSFIIFSVAQMPRKFAEHDYSTPLMAQCHGVLNQKTWKAVCLLYNNKIQLHSSVADQQWSWLCSEHKIFKTQPGVLPFLVFSEWQVAVFVANILAQQSDTLRHDRLSTILTLSYFHLFA